MDLRSESWSGRKKTPFWIRETEAIIVRRGENEKIIPLHQANEEEIFVRRMKNIPTFVLKVGEDFYITDISYNLYLNYNINCVEPEHLCTNCEHCRALLEELGGCAKVRDCSAETYLQEGNSYRNAIVLSKRIEKYPFIQYGYETFGVSHEILCVSDCKNYEKYIESSRAEITKVMNWKHYIAEYYHQSE